MIGPGQFIFGTTVDRSPPGAPVIEELIQVGRSWQMLVSPPRVDADGGELTGLKRLLVVTTNTKFQENATYEQAVATPGAIMNDFPMDPGSQLTISIPDLRPGEKQFFAVYCDDGAADPTSSGDGTGVAPGSQPSPPTASGQEGAGNETSSASSTSAESAPAPSPTPSSDVVQQPGDGSGSGSDPSSSASESVSAEL